MKTRFKLIRLHLKMSQAEFAGALKMKQGNVSQIELENTDRGVPEKAILLLEKLYGVNPDWLETGIGSMLIPPDDFLSNVKSLGAIPGIPDSTHKVKSNAKAIGNINEPLAPYETESNSKYTDLGDGQLLMVIRKVPEQARMGYVAGWKDPEFLESLEYHTIIVSKRHRGNYMAFEAVGDSMENYETPEMAKDSIPNGSTVTGREIGQHLWKSKFHNHRWPDFVFVHEDGIIIKRLIDHNVEEGIITIRSLNPNKKLYPDKTYHLDEMKQIFNVVNVSIER